MGGRRKTGEGISSQEEWVSLQTCVDQFAGAFGYMPLVNSLLRCAYFFKPTLAVLLLYVHLIIEIQAGPGALQRPSVKFKKEVQGIGGSPMRTLESEDPWEVVLRRPYQTSEQTRRKAFLILRR